MHKIDYQRFCAEAPADFPLFMQAWYLDAVCAQSGTWDAAVVQKAGRVVAVLPYFLKQKWGGQYVAMPPLARLMGPYIVPALRNTAKETGILDELLAQLPKLVAFEQDFNYTATNWLPFYWQGFRQTTRYSYTLDIQNLEAVWANVASDYRKQKIPKAQELVSVNASDDLSEFYRVQNLSYARQGLQPPIPFDFLQRLDAALAMRKQRAIFFATDRQTGATHAAAYLVWDTHSAYFLLAGDDAALRQSGAGILLAWEAIRYASSDLHLPVFDFAGSMLRPIERVRRQFGATQVPYFRVQREWSWLWRVGKYLFR